MTTHESIRAVEHVGVIGAGTMGAGIAQVFATAGFSVTVVDAHPDALARAEANVNRQWERARSKNRMTADDIAAARSRLRFAGELEEVTNADLVVEAIFEDVNAKTTLVDRLGSILKPEAIIASNTSSIPITLLGASSARPDRTIGMHFFNPVPVLELVEIIRGLSTSDATVSIVRDTTERLGKTPVVVRDYPGFVANRLLIPMINEAITCLDQGIAGRDEIDTIMKLGAAHPMGPLELADLIGLDVCLDILRILHRDLGEDRYRPSPLLSLKVAAGHTGRKSGEGFYQYPKWEV